MLAFNFKKVFHARGIYNIYTTLMEAGFSQRVARNISEDSCKTLLLSHAEKLCTMLNCTPNDLIHFLPGNNQNLSDNHALRKLEPKKLPSLQGLFDNCTLGELEELVEAVKEIRKKKVA